LNIDDTVQIEFE